MEKERRGCLWIWLSGKMRRKTIPTEKKIVSKAPAKISSDGKKKLSWNEQRELEKMEDAIGKAEAEVEVLQVRVGDPTVLADHIKMHEACEKLAAGQREVERLYTRWSELRVRGRDEKYIETADFADIADSEEKKSSDLIPVIREIRG